MRLRFILAHARREARSSARRLGPYVLSITLGVGALVAIHSFRAGIDRSVGAQARQLLGGDAHLSSAHPFPSRVLTMLDSVSAAGDRVAYTTTLASMVRAPAHGTVRLLQVQGVTADYPLYGGLEAKPAGAWTALQSGDVALAEPSALIQLGASVGDTLTIGSARFRLIGTVSDATPDVGFRAALGPRVYLARSALARTGLIVTGSLARYEAFIATPSPQQASAFVAAGDSLFHADRIGVETAPQRARRLSRELDSLSRFLGLVGLIALLLGGIGVASAVAVYTREKLPTVATLRCLGARQGDVFLAYLLQAGLLGLIGGLGGVVLGILARAVLGQALASSLPVQVGFSIDPTAVLAGVLTGIWVALVFALIPLLEVRGVSPLKALRRDYETTTAPRALRLAAYLAVVASVVALAVWQAPRARTGVAFAAGVTVVVALLWGLARVLMRAARRLLPARAAYTLRQGIANLFRPHNQTVTVTLALGFGVFIIGTLLVVQHSLLSRFRIAALAGRPNLLLFDMQPDQMPGVRALLAAHGVALQEPTPIVPATIAAVRGRTVAEWMADTVRAGHPARWALRREYRDTYRDSLTATERIVAGKWWTGPVRPGQVVQVSLDQDVASELRVGLGDTIVWNVQGVHVPSVVTSLRHVEWARFSPNFFAVFQPGALEHAPQMVVALANVPGDSARAHMQVALVRRFPNISVLDLERVQQAIASISNRVSLAVRVMGGLVIAAGLIVLFAAAATSREQRLRESALLKALGADRRRIRRILLTEFAALGTLAALTGALLAVAAGWALDHRFFNLPFVLPVGELLALAAVVTVLTLAVGLLNAREAVRRPPLAVLREVAE